MDALAGIDRVLEGLDGELDLHQTELLTGEEIKEFNARCNRLRSAGLLPAPSGGMPSVPWPLFKVN